jgi:D-3-phosphoglycerate dehydrogenase
MPKIWTDIKLVAEAKAALAGKAEVFGPGVAPAGSDPLQGIEEAEAALSASRVRWDAALFQRAKQLRIVARSGIGYDNIDVAAATAAGVGVTNTPESPTEATAELTIGLLLSVVRKICVADRRLRAEGWVPNSELVGTELAGRTLGLVGFGRIGQRVAEIARALRMTVIAYDPVAQAETARARGVELKPDLPAVLAQADFVSLHIPMSAENRHLIGAAELARMKRGAVLINAARGPLVVESALVAALQSGQLGGAALDVWNPEPTTLGNPLLRMDNVVATPHLGGITAEALHQGHVGAAECVLQALRGERPKNLVNPEVWARHR